MDVLTFKLNNKTQNVPIWKIKPELTLNEYLRKNLHLTGTKYMCLEGGCGACLVVAKIKNPRTEISETLAVNSCLVSLLSCAGWEITTIEGLGNRADGYDEIQNKLVQFNGTQCGFCTPGMVMNMYALKNAGKTLTMAEIEDSFGGNICRCTGYRPILAAFKSMASDADDKVLGFVPDIENAEICAGRVGKACQDTCSKWRSFPRSISESGRNWYKVNTIEEIFKVFRMPENSGRSYRLVAGNTAKGVFADMNRRDYYIDISTVKELRMVELNTGSFKLGANLSLNETMAVFKEISKKDQGFKYLTQVAEHIDVVASVPIRNIGTIAGNLTMKHVHNEFPSDIFLLLEVIGATLIIDNGQSTKILQQVTPQEYLSIDMTHKILRQIELPPLNSDYRFESYKITPRLQNAHAIVNAGFLLKVVNGNQVQDARIVYGGINPSFVHATEAENFLKGKELFNNANMQHAFSKLAGELHPDHVLPDASPDFRKELAIALLYKFILSIAPEKVLSTKNKSAGDKLLRPPVSKGTQDYKTNASMYPLGEPIRKLEAADQASGEAKYITDELDLHNQLYAVFVMGEARPGSVLTGIDPKDALKMVGVEAFFQASDIDDLGGVNSFMAPGNVFFNEEEPIFLPVGEPIKYYYQPVGVIVANSKALAEEASGLVKVNFDESQESPLLTVSQVLNAKVTERVVHEETRMAKKQNLNAAVHFKGQFQTTWKYHNHMELQVASVQPTDDGGLTVHAGTQWMDAVQTAISRSLNIPAHRICTSVKRIGGSFGAKITRNNWVACVAALAAHKLQKPVKCMMTLTANMNIMGKRNSVYSAYDVGVDDLGRIQYLNHDFYNNVGCYANALIEPFSMELIENTYNIDAFQTDVYYVRTDNPAATMMRGPGSVEGMAVIENIMEHIAYRVDLDPIDVRLSNLDIDRNPLLKTLIDECLEWSQYRNRRVEIEAFNAEHRWRKRGIAIAPMTYGLMFLGSHYAQVAVFQADGTVAISHGGAEIGQGMNTKVAQVAAYYLGIPIDMIKVHPANNFIAPNHFATGGAITTEAISRAVKEACLKLKTRIDQAVQSEKGWSDKVKDAFNLGVSLTENTMFFDNPDETSNYKVYGIAVSEVEVDLLTGMHLIRRVDLLEDTGDSLNPYIDIGQCEGAFVLGCGGWLSENIVMDEADGALKTNTTWTYKVPGARDIPVEFNVKFPEGIPNAASPFKNKATSEPPTCLAFSVPLAIKHALKSARIQSDSSADPWFAMDGPLTVEAIFTNSLNAFTQYVL